jgi:MFS family permease
MFQVRFTALRLAHHAQAIKPTLRDGLLLGIRKHEIDPRLVRFLGAAALFNFGLSIYFLLFNVFVIQRGFQEDLVGAVASAMSLGSIAGTLPGAYVLKRFGAGRVLLAAFLITPAMCALRVLAAMPAVMIPAAFLGGMLFAFYAVSIPPVVAGFTTERSRRTGFSIVFASGIGIGILAGFAGGHLPAILSRIPALTNVSLTMTLLAACAISLLGAIPIARLDLGAPQKNSASRNVYPSDASVLKFLAVLLIWNVAVGAFNPFFSVFFTKELGMHLGDLGTLFSAGQAVQVAALLIAPWLLRRFGTIPGLSLMQGTTALALASLASGVSGWIAAAVYTIYVASQYMTEPAIYSLLMERVSPEERGGASALNFLIVFGGQALAAAAAGFAVRRLGYRIVLAVAGLLALSAALSMRRLLASRASSLSRTAAIS